MEQLNYSHVFILLIQCVLTSGVLLFLFRLRIVMGIGLLFAALGVFQYMQVFLANTLYYEIYPGLVISPGSSVLFSVNLFMILLIYIREDAVVLRTLVYALVAANLILSLLQFTFGYHLESQSILNPYNLPPDIFMVNARVIFVGTLLLFIDAVFIVLLYEYISKLTSSLFLRILTTMALVLSLDSILFSVGGFAGTGQFQGIFISGIVSKLIASVIYTVLFTAYLYYFEQGTVSGNSASFKDIFYLLTYRQKFEQIFAEKEEQQLKANKALEESEQRFRALYENSPDMLLSVSPEGGLIRLCNNTFLEETGYTKEEVVGLPIFNFYHPDCLPDVEKAFQQFVSTGSIRNQELILKKKNDSTIDISLNVDAIKDQTGAILYSISSLRDITKMKKKEKALRESKEQLSKAEQIAHIGNWTYDIATKKIMCSEELYRIFGRSTEDLPSVSDNFLSWVHPEDQDKFAAFFQQMLNIQPGETSKSISYRINRPSGELRWIEVLFEAEFGQNIKLEKLFGVALDITEAKQLDEWKNLNAAILEMATKGNPLEEVLSEIILGIDRLIPQAMTSIMLIDEKNQLVSAARSKLPPSWLEIVDHMDITSEAAPFGRAVYYRKRIVTPDIKTDPLCENFREAALQHNFRACWSEPIIGYDHNTALGAFGMYFPEPRYPSEYETQLIESVAHLLSVIIEKAQAERELVNYKDHLEELVQVRTIELEKANKELESFSYSVSHDLRAPLTRLDGFSRALQKSYADKLDEKAQHYLKRIRASSQNMASLIDSMLQLSKITRQEIRKEEIDLGEIAKGIVKNLQESQPERKISLKLHPNLTAKMDPTLSRLMLDNLIQNAWKFTKKKDIASIEVGKTERKGSTWFFIKDNGIGFDMKYYEQLFQPFQRLHSSVEVEGSGIGLATVGRIIHKHGGQVEAEGIPNQGATFFFKV